MFADEPSFYANRLHLLTNFLRDEVIEVNRRICDEHNALDIVLFISECLHIL